MSEYCHYLYFPFVLLPAQKQKDKKGAWIREQV